MKNLRRWELDANEPLALHLTADARLCRTDYADDQTWHVNLGVGDSPALALQTKYGGRVGLASLVPLWIHEGHTIYQAQTYHEVPTIRHFAPNYMHLTAAILPDLDLDAIYWVMDSHAIGGIFRLHNRSNAAITLRLDIFGHVGAGGQEQPLGLINLREGGNALYMGEVMNIKPVLMMEKANAYSDGGSSPRIGVDMTIAPDESATVRWVHVGLPDMREGLRVARGWLNENWATYLQQINVASLAVPTVQTGNTDWDAIIEASINRVVQAFLKPTGSFPRHTYVATRTPENGYSRHRDGSAHPRGWSGQDPFWAYQIAPVMASIQPDFAQGIIKNYLAVQKRDGWIDLKPGTAGQRMDLLCTPLLARITWHIYQQTQDETFLRESFPGLLTFFSRWLAEDMDADNDGFPEWQDERQTGYVYMPTFAQGQAWSQGLNINTVESPDLAAYLLSEANSLRQMAQLLGEDKALEQLDSYIEALEQALYSLWNGTTYAYRDRDTNITASGMVLLEGGAGDEAHLLEQPLLTPNRVIVRIIGGVNHVPRVKLTIHGLDVDGYQLTETLTNDAIIWQNRQGVVTTQAVFSQVNRIVCDGLSRVYKIYARTADTTAIDVNGLLPLWAGNLPPEIAQQLIKLATDSDHFWRTNGITMVSAQEAKFDPTNAKGGGGIWPFWAAVIAEGLLLHGATEAASDMLKNMLKMMTDVMAQDGRFHQYYHSEKSAGLGEYDHLAGIVPVHLLWRTFGIRIYSRASVLIERDFAWARAVTVRQHGVSVRRTTKGVKIKFPSGHTVELDATAETQTITDPNPGEATSYAPIQLPEAAQPAVVPQPVTPPAPRKVIIEVEFED